MFKYPQDLDALRAVVEKAPEAWLMDYFEPWASTHEFWEESQTWPPVPLDALERLPNVAFLAERDRRFAEEHPDLPVTDILEALRYFRVLAKFHAPDTLFWEQVFHTGRTLSALNLYHAAAGRQLHLGSGMYFLLDLIYRNRIRDYTIEGNTYRIGYWTLSLPWPVVASGIVPECLQLFGQVLNRDAINPGEDNLHRLGALELRIHDCPSSNPWLLPQTREFLLGIADKWGWYTALDEKHTDPYTFYATCVDPARIDELGFQQHPLELAASETSRMGISLQRIHDLGERVGEIAQLFEEAIHREMEFPAADPE